MHQLFRQTGYARPERHRRKRDRTVPDDPPPLRPATAEKIAESPSFALRYDGRRRVRYADEATARTTAEQWVRVGSSGPYTPQEGAW
jgi:hypothetical protein